MQTSDEQRGYMKGYVAGKRWADRVAFCSDEPSPQAAEVAWYRLHGRYPDRVRLDSRGDPYVIGDHCWGNKNAVRHEAIERLMASAGVYRPLGE